MRVVPTLVVDARGEADRSARRAARAAARGRLPPERRLPPRWPAGFRTARPGACCATTSASWVRRWSCSSADAARRLEPVGRAAARRERSATRRLARILPGLAVELARRRSADVTSDESPLRVAASHDLALAALATRCPSASGLALDLPSWAVCTPCRNSPKVEPTSPAFTCRSACTPRLGARAVPAPCSGAARPADPLCRSRPGTHPSARQSGAASTASATRAQATAVRQSAARIGHPAADRPMIADEGRAASSRSSVTATKSSRIRPSRRRSHRAARTQASGCARPPPSIGSPSSRW